jgi:CRP-like cAMP-binding protein
MNAKMWHLRNMDFFNDLSNEDYDIIDRDSNMKTIKKGDYIYLEGTSDKNIYFLKSGAVKLTKIRPDGKTLTLDILNKGALFGELNDIDPSERDETAQALEDSLICTMKKDNFDALLKKVPLLSKRIYKISGFRFRKIENRLVDLLYSTVEERLAKILLKLSDDFGVSDNGRRIIKIKLTHNDLSELIASTRETVTATIKKFKDRGLISYKGKYIALLDKSRLQTISEHV